MRQSATGEKLKTRSSWKGQQLVVDQEGGEGPSDHRDVHAAAGGEHIVETLRYENSLLPAPSLWPLAVVEGRVAGYNMAGKKTKYGGGTNMSSLKYFGIPIVSIGLANPKEDPTLEVLIKHDKEKNVYKKLVLRNNVIVGMTFVNYIERAGILFHLMKNT